jgi:hypothetical protein
MPQAARVSTRLREAERDHTEFDAVPTPALARSRAGAVGAAGGVAGRRTVTIRGQTAQAAPRRPPRRVYERAGARPDRIAMWAVLLGLLLVLVAAASSHAAVVHAAHVALHLN